MSAWKGVPTWKKLENDARRMEQQQVRDFNSFNKDKKVFATLDEIMNYLYGGRGFINSYISKEKVWDQTLEDIQNAFMEFVAENPEITEKEILGELCKARVTIQEAGHSKNWANSKPYWMAMERYIKKRVAKESGLIEDVRVGNANNFFEGFIIEARLMDTFGGIYGEDSVSPSKRRNDSYDYSHFGVYIEAKKRLTPLRYMEKSDASYEDKQALKVLRENAVERARRGTFRPRDYLSGFVRFVIKEKLKDTRGAVFIMVDGRRIRYILASDFIKDLRESNGGRVIDTPHTKLYVDDIDVVWEGIRRSVLGTKGVQKNGKPNSPKTILWYMPNERSIKIAKRPRVIKEKRK